MEKDVLQVLGDAADRQQDARTFVFLLEQAPQSSERDSLLEKWKTCDKAVGEMIELVKRMAADDSDLEAIGQEMGELLNRYGIAL